MNALVKMSSVDNEDLNGLRKFFDDVTSHMRSLGVESQTYESLLCPIILEKLPNKLRLIISRNNNKNDWNFTKILDLINVELKAREACVVPSHTAAEGKNDFRLSSPSHTRYPRHQFIDKIGNSKKGVVKATQWRVVGGNVFFVMETTGRKNVGLSQMYKLGKIC